MPENKTSNDLRQSLLEENSQNNTNNFQSPNSAFQQVRFFSQRQNPATSNAANSSTHTHYSKMSEENPNKSPATDSQAQGGCCIS